MNIFEWYVFVSFSDRKKKIKLVLFDYLSSCLRKPHFHLHFHRLKLRSGFAWSVGVGWALTELLLDCHCKSGRGTRSVCRIKVKNRSRVQAIGKQTRQDPKTRDKKQGQNQNSNQWNRTAWQIADMSARLMDCKVHIQLRVIIKRVHCMCVLIGCACIQSEVNYNYKFNGNYKFKSLVSIIVLDFMLLFLKQQLIHQYLYCRHATGPYRTIIETF